MAHSRAKETLRSSPRPTPIRQTFDPGGKFTFPNAMWPERLSYAICARRAPFHAGGQVLWALGASPGALCGEPRDLETGSPLMGAAWEVGTLQICYTVDKNDLKARNCRAWGRSNNGPPC